MVDYKWVALSNTTLGVLMASINGNIVLISLPAIFRGINVDPLTSFQYLLWVLFGYMVVTASLLVMFGRISDMYGRVKLYNLGFAIFTAGSILLYLTPNTGDLGAQELIIFRIVQGLGAAFLFANSAAIITDAFPYNERGKALGINQVAALVGSLGGLILGGVLSVFDWRDVFLVSVPIGIAGTVWSYWKLKEIATIRKGQRLDIWGNVTWGAGLTILLVAATYGLLPYGSSTMGWSNPWVMAALAVGIALLAVFPFIETKVKDPMFRLGLFKNRMFSAANFAGLLASVGRGGVMIMLIILLQGIWLPLHGYSYESTPFWSGIYMIPMLAGFAVMGPLSGWLSDRYGARGFSTLGMVIVGVTFYALAVLPYNFSYLPLAVILFVMGIGSGMFASPNTASIMNSVPMEQRGAASGMRSTLQNTGSVASLALFFSIVISALAGKLPAAFVSAFNSAGVPQLGTVFAQIPPTGALFAAFLGYNPVGSIIAQLQNSPQTAQLVASVPQQTMSYITGNSFFPNAIAPAFMTSLAVVFYIGLGLSLAAATSSLLRGRVYIYEKEAMTAAVPRVPLPITTSAISEPDPGPQATNASQSNPGGGSLGVVPRREKEEDE